MTAPRATVGLLTWNAGPSAIPCVRSLLSQTEALDIIWIDNASTDDTVKLIQAEFQNSGLSTQDSGLVINSRNLGFCAGHNQALARCKTKYYLALNQDVVLAPDYVERLCDWMDEDPQLALVSGLLLWSDTPDPGAPIYSAGLVWPRAGFPFELRMGRTPRPGDRLRRRVPGVTGAAMLLRVEACRSVSIPPEDIFPSAFFAYHEEVDLALRLARAGLACGIEGQALAWHAGGGSGGLRNRSIRANYFANHWLLPLRNQPWSMIAREVPYAMRGELQYWLPRYLKTPIAALTGAGRAVAQVAASRRLFHQFERQFGPTASRLAALKRQSLDLLRKEKH
ncbi:glycosyltransferase family 2 protein [bacterium]|nr:glycosyltransferase family 2 protein [bacterium]